MNKLNRLVIPLALSSAVVAGLVMNSPIGIGNGSGVIGYSIVRLLIFFGLHLPIAVAGVSISVIASRHQLPCWPGLLSHIVVATVTVWLYFVPSDTIENWFR